MRLSMHNWMRPEPLTETLARLARWGYDGVELASEPRTTDVETTRRQLAEHGIECAGTLALFLGGRDLLHEDSYIREAGLTYLLETITLTAELGGSFVTIPGTVGKVTPSAAPEVEWSWLVDALSVARDHAATAGVRLAIEPLNRFETHLINRADQALALAATVGGDTGVCLDIFHMCIEEADWAAAIRETGSLLANFHVAENNRMPPGQGSVDWERLLRELAGIGYDGWLSVEFMPAMDRSPEGLLQMAEAGSDEGLSAGMRKWIVDHGSGVLPDETYDLFVKNSAENLRRHLDKV